MPRTSKKTKVPPPMTKAEIEAERKVADWYASPAGRRHVERVMDKGIRDGTAILVDGSKVNLTPAKIEALLQEARDKSTQAVSLRIPRADLDAAKRIAAKKRIGYQTVLKQAIHAGVREMS